MHDVDGRTKDLSGSDQDAFNSYLGPYEFLYFGSLAHKAGDFSKFRVGASNTNGGISGIQKACGDAESNDTVAVEDQNASRSWVDNSGKVIADFLDFIHGDDVCL